MTQIIIIALLLSSIIYLVIGVLVGRKNSSLADLFPLVFGANAKIVSSDEFSKSTVATSVSLATIVLAYFELSGYFGLYLLWTVITSVLGIVIVSAVSKKIWLKMNSYNERPSMHEFLGVEYNSSSVSIIASICTSIGVLMVFATELIVGSRFLAGLIPSIPENVVVIFLSIIGFTYTLIGGFRAVVKTDQIQMWFIWSLIIALGSFTIYKLFHTGLFISIEKAPETVFSLSWRDGLGSFLIGLTVMNIPAYLSNMSIWQRISAAENSNIVTSGFKRSIWGMIFSWGSLALIACFAYTIVIPESPQNFLVEYLKELGNTSIGSIFLFITVLGLYGALLSTASTNLIVVAHTISEDLVAKFRKLDLNQRIDSKNEVFISKIILFLSAIVAIFLVEGLNYIGFSIADLVFAIYGGALVLFPPILFALYNTRERLSKISNYVTLAVVLGFIFAWGSAVYGRSIGNVNLVFLAPCFGIGISTIITGLGWFVITKK